MAVQKFTIDDGGQGFLRIYAEPSNLNHFLTDALEPDQEDGVENISVQIGGHTRRQYPGDTSRSNVAGGTRVILRDSGRRTGNALPGKTFSMRSFDDDGNELQFRQFTYQGSFLNLHSFLFGQVTNTTHLYNHTGGPPYVLTVQP
jgi:hypothetical protein